MSLQERLRGAQKREFVGRSAPLALFKQSIQAEIPIYPIIQIEGQGGVGKTTLLKQFQSLCDENGVAHALTDHDHKTPIEAMYHMAQLLERAGFSLHRFNEHYGKYTALRDRIIRDTSASDNVTSMLSKVIGKGVVVASRTTPVTSSITDLLGAQLVEENVIALSNYLFQKLKSAEDVHLLLDPVSEISPIFLSAINGIARSKQAVLMFDTFEETQELLLPWIMKVFIGDYGEVSEKITFIFAGRVFDEADWLLVKPLLTHISLEPFTKKEVAEYLANHEIKDDAEVEEVYQLSGGLPVYVAMLASSSKPSSGRITRTVVERFLRNINDPVKRQIVLKVGLARGFDRDLIAVLASPNSTPSEVKSLFDWLMSLPFVDNPPGYWVYHPVVRSQMITHQRNESLSEFQEVHVQLAKYYLERVHSIEPKAPDSWQSLAWWGDYVEFTYHSLCAEPHRIAGLKKEIAKTMLNFGGSETRAWSDALRQAAADIGGAEPIIDLAVLVESGLRALETGNWRGAFKLLDVFGMLWKYPRNMDFEEGVALSRLPIGWFAGGSHPQHYEIGVDSMVLYAGKSSGSIKSRTAGPTETARLIQVIEADDFREKRIRLSGYVKSLDVAASAGLQVAIIGADDQTLVYDDMADRLIQGTTEWTQHSLVLDVPRESARMMFGLFLEGDGQVWVDALSLEVVDASIPSTATYPTMEPMNLRFQLGTGTKRLPMGWHAYSRHPKDYEMGVDHEVSYNQEASAYIKSTVSMPQDFGTLMQTFKADKYREKKLRLVAYVRSEDVEGEAGLWMRVDGPTKQGSLRFDNMSDRPIEGTRDWRQYDLVLSIPRESTFIAFGIRLHGRGKVWVSDCRFEIVPEDVPETNLKSSQHPYNLDFGEDTYASHLLPRGWSRVGSRFQEYQMGVDMQMVYEGKPSAYIRSIPAKVNGFGALMQSFKANVYRGKQLRMFATVRAQDVEGGAGLWMRVDGPNPEESLGFDNMSDRLITGTTDWQRYSIVLGVPEQSTEIAFGILLAGTGQVWVNNFQFEVVSSDLEAVTEDHIKRLSEALAKNTNDIQVLLKRGYAYFNIERYEEALADYTRVLSLDPGNIHALVNRGLCFMQIGNYVLAISTLSEAVRQNPEHASAYYNLACANALRGDLKAAIAALRRTFELNAQRYVKLASDDPDFSSVRDKPRFRALLLEFERQDDTN